MKVAIVISILYQLAYLYALYQVFPGMARYGHGQREGKTNQLTDLFQIAVDGVDGCIVLPPLLLRCFRRDNRKQIRGVGTGVFVHYLLQERIPPHGFFPSRNFRHISKAVIGYVVFRKIKDVPAGHAFGEDGKQKDVAGEQCGRMQTAHIHVTELHNFLGSQPVFLFLYPVTYVHPLKRMAFPGYTVRHGQPVHPLQITDIERNGIPSQFLIFNQV